METGLPWNTQINPIHQRIQTQWIPVVVTTLTIINSCWAEKQSNEHNRHKVISSNQHLCLNLRNITMVQWNPQRQAIKFHLTIIREKQISEKKSYQSNCLCLRIGSKYHCSSFLQMRKSCLSPCRFYICYLIQALCEYLATLPLRCPMPAMFFWSTLWTAAVILEMMRLRWAMCLSRVYILC